MSLQIVERPAITVVGLHIVTKPRSPEIPGLWPKFVPRIDEITNSAEPNVSYGMMWHAPGSMAVLDYMAAVSVSGAGAVPDGMTRLDVAAGTYACVKYPLSGLSQGFGELFEKLLPASGYTQVHAPYFERYDEKFDPRNPGSLVEICLPVRR